MMRVFTVTAQTRRDYSLQCVRLWKITKMMKTGLSNYCEVWVILTESHDYRKKASFDRWMTGLPGWEKVKTGDVESFSTLTGRERVIFQAAKPRSSAKARHGKLRRAACGALKTPGEATVTSDFSKKLDCWTVVILAFIWGCASTPKF